MSWKQSAGAVGSAGLGCLNHILMWMVVAPALAILLALAWYAGDPVWLLATGAFALLALVLYVLASWD